MTGVNVAAFGIEADAPAPVPDQAKQDEEAAGQVILNFNPPEPDLVLIQVEPPAPEEKG